LELLTKRRPVAYTLDVDKINEFLNVIEKDPDYKSSGKKSQIIYSGFIPQEVEEAALSIGYQFSGVDAPDNEHDLYGIRYADLVVPLVKAV